MTITKIESKSSKKIIALIENVTTVPIQLKINKYVLENTNILRSAE